MNQLNQFQLSESVFQTYGVTRTMMHLSDTGTAALVCCYTFSPTQFTATNAIMGFEQAEGRSTNYLTTKSSVYQKQNNPLLNHTACVSVVQT